MGKVDFILTELNASVALIQKPFNCFAAQIATLAFNGLNVNVENLTLVA